MTKYILCVIVELGRISNQMKGGFAKALRSSRFPPSSKFSKAVTLRMPVVRLMDQTLMQMGKRVRTCSWRVIKTARQAISVLVTSTTILPSQTMKMWGAISTCTCKTAARLSVPFMFHPVVSLTTNNVSTEQRLICTMNPIFPRIWAILAVAAA